MSGICSRHQGHDPDCDMCNAFPLTEEDKAYYRGWDESRKCARANGWCFVENIVLDAYEALEKAVRDGDDTKPVLERIDELRNFNRGFGRNE